MNESERPNRAGSAEGLSAALRDLPYEDATVAVIDHHRSLRTGVPEVIYGAGKTPAQIRDGIIRGDWQKVDLAKYQKDYLPPVSAPAK